MEHVQAAFEACAGSVLSVLDQQQKQMAKFMAEMRHELAVQTGQIQLLTDAVKAKDVELEQLRLEVKTMKEKESTAGMLTHHEVKSFGREIDVMKAFLAKKFMHQKDMAVQSDPVEIDEEVREQKTKMEVLARETCHAIYAKVITSLQAIQATPALRSNKREEAPVPTNSLQKSQSPQASAIPVAQDAWSGYERKKEAYAKQHWPPMWEETLTESNKWWVSDVNLDIRSQMVFGRPQTAAGVVPKGRWFEVSKIMNGPRGKLLRLADGRGWVPAFDGYGKTFCHLCQWETGRNKWSSRQEETGASSWQETGASSWQETGASSWQETGASSWQETGTNLSWSWQGWQDKGN